MSVHAMPSDLPPSATAARWLLAPADSKLSSVSVPGVIKRMTSRLTSACDPRSRRACAGSSVCSQMATLNP